MKTVKKRFEEYGVKFAARSAGPTTTGTVTLDILERVNDDLQNKLRQIESYLNGIDEKDLTTAEQHILVILRR